jgi:phenylalanyl-tRNA synthetase alpha chain
MIHSLIDKIRKEFKQELKELKFSKDVESLKTKHLGKKGSLQALMEELKNTPPELRPSIGREINELKVEVASQLDELFNRLSNAEKNEQLKTETVDISLPGVKDFDARKHLITQMNDKIINIMIGMGFSVQEGPNLDTDFYNFESLNFPKDHPARDMQDTFYVDSEYLLRTHTSNVQVRVMQQNRPPIRIISPGRCFRNESISARSHVMFHQVEAVYIDKKVTFADLLATMDEFWNKLFEKDIKTRYRPSYFPFVEPGMEGDISCTMCSGKGCRLCKHSGWLEVIGAGMIHPNVLQSGGIDPEEYSGYAWGLGLERLSLLYYDIPDIRLLWDDDLRFLSQF